MHWRAYSFRGPTLAHGAFFTLCPHLPALSAPKPKRKYKRGSNLSLSATMRENTSGDTTNSIIPTLSMFQSECIGTLFQPDEPYSNAVPKNSVPETLYRLKHKPFHCSSQMNPIPYSNSVRKNSVLEALFNGILTGTWITWVIIQGVSKLGMRR